MPRQSQVKVLILVFVLAVLTIYYVINGARDTKESPFYTRTMAAIEAKESAAARKNMLAEEKQRNDRVERLRKEHDAAVLDAVATAADSSSKPMGDSNAGQQPLVNDAGGTTTPAAATATETEQGMAGPKKAKDEKIVEGKPGKDHNDGVAKVGNVDSEATSISKDGHSEPESEQDHQIEAELNNLLKKGPLIVFSKTYCPFSKKAKHILQDLYNITPEPYIVELDEHSLGPGLQRALEKTTGRRTVPNVLVNGKSIGGGDDIAELHESGKLAKTLQSLGGNRITSVVARPSSSDEDAQPRRSEAKFKA